MDQFSHPPPQPLPPMTPLEATLTAQEWNIVQAALHEMVRALSEKITQQLFVQARQLAQKQEE